MFLRNLPESAFDERIVGSDSSGRSSTYRIELGRSSWGTFALFDARDYYAMTPGVGTFELDVTSDLSNAFGADAGNTEFGVTITDANGTVLFQASTAGPDVNTRQIIFNSTSNDTYYVQIDNLSGRQFGYLATVRTVEGGTPANTIAGTDGADTLVGGAGGESITAGAGADSVTSLGGADTIDGGAGANYLRGDDGNDLIFGGANFDDINGNMGNDTASGGVGDDWVVGGKDSDLLHGDDGNDLVYGNLGADTLEGGAGNDIVRGGQDNDLIYGDAGNDFMSGDKGDDSMVGGAGADIFHTFGDAGLDTVIDFHGSEGDRVQLDPGTVYTVAQSGSEVVITMVGGGRMVLVNSSLGSLPEGWIFGA